MKLREIIDGYIKNNNCTTLYNVDGEFCIVENASFAILPNHPYRSPIAVAIYCLRGRGIGRLNAKQYTISQRGFFIVQPGQITEMVDVSDDFCAVYILMSEEFLASLGIGNTFNIQTIISEEPFIMLEDRADEALNIFLKMCINLIPIDKNPHRIEIIRLLTRAFFLGLGYFLHEQSSAKSSDNRALQLTERFLRLVEANYRVHRDLKFYADHLSLTPKYLSSQIKTASGKSAMEWIEKYVTLDAITQLTSTNRTIKEIAYDLNFPSQSCFGKYFNRVVGSSPLAYRNTVHHATQK